MRAATIVAIAVLGACGPAARDDVSLARAAEREVYVAIVDSLYVRPDTRLIVLWARTSRRAEEVRGDHTAPLHLTPSMLRDFEARNADPGTLTGDLGLSLPVVYATPETFEGVPLNDPEAYWRAFDAKFPGASGIMFLSRPGFDQDLQRAVVSLELSYGSFGGHGAIVTLRRIDGKWRVDQDRTTWIS